MNEQRRGAILDRDATLIDVVRDEESGAISVAFHPDQLRLLPGVIDGLGALSHAGYVLCIATNQPGPAKGQFSRAAVERTNQALLELLAAQGIRIEALEVCLHHPDGGPGGDSSLVGPCDCRKPKPGLLLRAIKQAGLSPESSWMIGDAPADLLAARAAGVQSALVLPLERCELCPLRGGLPLAPDLADSRFDRLVERILERDRDAWGGFMTDG